MVREEEIRARLASVFERHRATISGLLPAARIEHVGSTAVPGSLTKGDLDVCVAVDAESFESAVELLRGPYAIHQPENWTQSFASFTATDETRPDVGVQVVVAGSEEEVWFVGWRDRLRADAELRQRYDELKRHSASAGVDAYRAAKEELIRTTLAP